jgi:tetratricopeptide (TPR) repeat protein
MTLCELRAQSLNALRQHAGPRAPEQGHHEVQADAAHACVKSAVGGDEGVCSERDKQELLALSAQTSVASMASCGRCLYDIGHYRHAGDVFVAAARLLSARACLLSADGCVGESVLSSDFETGRRGAGERVRDVDGREKGRSQVGGGIVERLIGDAVRCYRKAGLFNTAVDVLLEMGQVESALRVLKDEHKYDRALKIIDEHAHVPLPPELSSHEFLRQAAAALGLACSNARDNGRGSGARRSRAAQAEEVARRQKREEAEQAFMQTLERLPELEGRRLLRRYGFHEVLEHRLMQEKDFVKAAHIMYEDQRGPRAVEMLLALHAPSSTELTLAALLCTALAFSSAGRRHASIRSGPGEQEAAVGVSCVEYLTKAALVLARAQGLRERKEQMEQARVPNQAADQGRKAAAMFRVLLRFESSVRDAALLAQPQEGLVPQLESVRRDAEECASILGVALVLQAQSLVALNAIAAGARASGADQGRGGAAASEGDVSEGDVDDATLQCVLQRVLQALRMLRQCARCVVGTSGRDEAEMRQYEMLLGLSRAVHGGALSISKFRLPLLLSILSHGHPGSAERLCTVPHRMGAARGRNVLEIQHVVVPDSDGRHQVLLDPVTVRLAVGKMLLDAILGACRSILSTASVGVHVLVCMHIPIPIHVKVSDI